MPHSQRRYPADDHGYAATYSDRSAYLCRTGRHGPGGYGGLPRPALRACQDRRNVVLDGAPRDHQTPSDVSVRQTLRHQRQHLGLAYGQPCRIPSPVRSNEPRRRPAMCSQQRASPRRSCQSAEGVKQLDRVGERGPLATAGQRQCLIVRAPQLAPDLSGFPPAPGHLQRERRCEPGGVNPEVTIRARWRWRRGSTGNRWSLASSHSRRRGPVGGLDVAGNPRDLASGGGGGTSPLQLSECRQPTWSRGRAARPRPGVRIRPAPGPTRSGARSERLAGVRRAATPSAAMLFRSCEVALVEGHLGLHSQQIQRP